MKRILSLSAMLVLLPQLSQGQGPNNILTLNFEGLQDQETVLDYYNGGFGGKGSGPGPKYGVTFLANSLALTSNTVGGTGKFINEPSPNNAVFFSSGGGDIMNVAGGFTGGFSFFYTGGLAGFVTVWSGPDGTGTQMVSLDLPALASGTPNTNDTWSPIGVAFNGVAGSVNFSGTANFIAFDNITLGSSVPTGASTPAPSSLLVVAMALTLGAGWRQRRRKPALNVR